MTSTLTPGVGVLGLGNMGIPIARNLLAAGFAVTGWDLAPRELPAPGRVTDDVAELGRSCETVLVVLPELEMVLPQLADDSLLCRGSVVQHLVVMSTASPVAVQSLADRLAPRGIAVVDAPMSGGVIGAQEASLSIMVGATSEDFATVKPVLDAVGSTVRLLGGVGAGSVAKACNQLVVAATLAALAEAALIAERSELDRAAVLDVLAGGLADSEVLRQKRHALAYDDFSVSGPAKFLVKDLRFAEEAARGARLPIRDAVSSLYTGLTDAGLGDLDNSVVLDYLRRFVADA